MNFKVFIILIFWGCGVKGPPTFPPKTAIPAWQDKFIKAPPGTPEEKIEEEEDEAEHSHTSNGKQSGKSEGKSP